MFDRENRSLEALTFIKESEDEICEYEKERLRKIEENSALLEELGLKVVLL